MPDIVGLIASAITIAAVVVEGVKQAKTFYNAHEEFEVLKASASKGMSIATNLFTMLYRSLHTFSNYHDLQRGAMRIALIGLLL